jgi:hypothetical protein
MVRLRKKRFWHGTAVVLLDVVAALVVIWALFG